MQWLDDLVHVSAVAFDSQLNDEMNGSGTAYFDTSALGCIDSVFQVRDLEYFRASQFCDQVRFVCLFICTGSLLRLRLNATRANFMIFGFQTDIS